MNRTDAVVTTALEQLAASDSDAASTAAECHSLLVEGGGAHAYSQFVIQGFLWHLLPRRWPAQERSHVVETMARYLEACGYERYAAICQSSETAAVLRAYDRSLENGYKRAVEAEARSGVAPPNFDGFQWSPQKRPMEIEASLVTAGVLELAIAAGELQPGSHGWLDRQTEIAFRCLVQPRPELGGDTFLDAIARERIEWWVHDGPEERRRLLEPLAPDLLRPIWPPDDLSGIEPVRWLLDQARHGLRVDRRGDPAPEIAHELRDRFGLRHEEGFDEPAGRILAVLDGLGLVRRRGRRMRQTPDGEFLRDDPPTLWRLLARSLWTAPRPHNAAAELAFALLLRGGPEREQRLAECIHLMLPAWEGATALTRINETRRALLRFGWIAEPFGMLEIEGTLSEGRGFILTELGKATALEALGARAGRSAA